MLWASLLTVKPGHRLENQTTKRALHTGYVSPDAQTAEAQVMILLKSTYSFVVITQKPTTYIHKGVMVPTKLSM